MKKRILAAIVFTVMAAAMLLPTAGMAVSLTQFVSTSNGKGVNMRTAPSKNAQIILTIPYGAAVDSYDYYDASWARVSYEGQYGYCMHRYFSEQRPSGTPASTSSGSTTNLFDEFVPISYDVVVRPSTPSGFVNMRWAPSKDQKIRSTYYAGYTLHVIAENDLWAQVYDANAQVCGFMMRAFLTQTGAEVLSDITYK